MSKRVFLLIGMLFALFSENIEAMNKGGFNSCINVEVDRRQQQAGWTKSSVGRTGDAYDPEKEWTKKTAELEELRKECASFIWGYPEKEQKKKEGDVKILREDRDYWRRQAIGFRAAFVTLMIICCFCPNIFHPLKHSSAK